MPQLELRGSFDRTRAYNLPMELSSSPATPGMGRQWQVITLATLVRSVVITLCISREMFPEFIKCHHLDSVVIGNVWFKIERFWDYYDCVARVFLGQRV